MPTRNTAIISTAAAGQSTEISIDSGSSVQVYCQPPLSNGEAIGVERSDGTNWIPVNEGFVDRGRGSATLTGPGFFRVTKTATTEATAVYYDS